MDKKLKIAIPVIAGIAALGSSVGVASAANVDQPQAVETAAAPQTRNTSTCPYYSGGQYGGMMRNGQGAGSGITQQLASLLNTTPADIQSRLQAGATLMDLADEQGVTQEQLVEAIMTRFNDHVNLMVKYGYISEDEAVTLRQRVREQVQTMVNTPNGEQLRWRDYMGEIMDDYGCPGLGLGPDGAATNGNGDTAAPGYGSGNGPGGMTGGYGGSPAAGGQSGHGCGGQGGSGGGFGGMMR